MQVVMSGSSITYPRTTPMRVLVRNPELDNDTHALADWLTAHGWGRDGNGWWRVIGSTQPTCTRYYNATRLIARCEYDNSATRFKVWTLPY